MQRDVSTLVQLDHEDLDRGLDAMVTSSTPRGELSSLLEVVRLAFAVHVAAESKVLVALLDDEREPGALHAMAQQTYDEHRCQQEALDELARLQPGSEAWYAHALELRILVLDHASRAELRRWTLHDRIPLTRLYSLAGEYATERLRILGRTSPVAFARAALPVPFTPRARTGGA